MRSWSPDDPGDPSKGDCRPSTADPQPRALGSFEGHTGIAQGGPIISLGHLFLQLLSSTYSFDRSTNIAKHLSGCVPVAEVAAVN